MFKIFNIPFVVNNNLILIVLLSKIKLMKSNNRDNKNILTLIDNKMVKVFWFSTKSSIKKTFLK